MHHSDIWARLSEEDDPVFSNVEMRAAGQAAFQIFAAKAEALLGPRGSALVSPSSTEFLATASGILLVQERDCTVVLERIRQGQNRALSWTPRNILHICLVGRLAYRLASVESSPANDQFREGLGLQTVFEGEIGPEQGYVKGKGVASTHRAVGTLPDALVVAFYSKPLGALDWMFDDKCLSVRATVCNPNDNTVDRALDTLLQLLEGGEAVDIPVEDLVEISRHPSYFIRWKALNILWQRGICDQLVAETVAADPHPEIHRHGEFFAGRLAS